MTVEGLSSVLSVCFESLKSNAEIADIVKLCLSNRCKMGKSIIEIWRFVKLYYDWICQMTPATVDMGQCDYNDL